MNERHIVVIRGRDTPEMTQALAKALGVLPFEAKQRLIGGGPAVAAVCGEAQTARSLAQRLTEAGLTTFVVNVAELQSDQRLAVRRFTLGATEAQIETAGGSHAVIPYATVGLLLAGAGTVSISETRTVTERKFSLGKTLLFGGIPMTSKVTREEEVTGEERRKHLYVYAGQQTFLFSQHSLNYEGLGQAKQLSQEANFAYLLGELRRRCSNAVYDDRLFNRQALAHLIGPARNPDTDLDLSIMILARALRASH